MELPHAFLQDSDRRSVFGARFIGRNVASNGAEAWVLSKTAQLHSDRSWIEPSTSQFVWLTTPGCEHSVTKSLARSVHTLSTKVDLCRIFIQPSKHSCPRTPWHVLPAWLAV